MIILNILQCGAKTADSSQCKKDRCTLWLSPRSTGARRHRRCLWRAVWLIGCGRRGSPFPTLDRVTSRRHHELLSARNRLAFCSPRMWRLRRNCKKIRIKSEVFLTVSYIMQMLLQDSSVSHLLHTVLNLV